MKEYTILATASAIAALALDHVSGVRVTRTRTFRVCIGVMMVFKIIVNGYLTGRPVVLYGEPFFLGFRLGTIPAEDFLFGFALITFSIVCWEGLLRRRLRPEAGREEVA